LTDARLMTTGRKDDMMTYDHANDPQLADMIMKYEGNSFRARVTHVRDSVARLLVNIDRHIDVIDEISRDKDATAAYIAERIAHDVLWAIPNMNLENLSHDAHKYDDAIATRRAIADTTTQEA
jgi:hypothetical protein